MVKISWVIRFSPIPDWLSVQWIDSNLNSCKKLFVQVFEFEFESNDLGMWAWAGSNFRISWLMPWKENASNRPVALPIKPRKWRHGRHRFFLTPHRRSAWRSAASVCCSHRTPPTTVIIKSADLVQLSAAKCMRLRKIGCLNWVDSLACCYYWHELFIPIWGPSTVRISSHYRFHNVINHNRNYFISISIIFVNKWIIIVYYPTIN